jgi:hypothetical protein
MWCMFAALHVHATCTTSKSAAAADLVVCCVLSFWTSWYDTIQVRNTQVSFRRCCSQSVLAVVLTIVQVQQFHCAGVAGTLPLCFSH